MKHINNKISFILDQAAKNHKAVPQVSQLQSFSVEEAYLIQKSSLELRYTRGEKHTGYKLGFTSRAKMEQMGLNEIIWGRLTDAMSIEQGVLDFSYFIHPRVEPEIAFLIDKKIDRKITSEEVPTYLRGVAGALEIIDSRYENFKFSLEDVIADNCSSAAYQIGTWHDATTPLDDTTIELVINDKTVQSGNATAILGHPYQALSELSDILTRQGMSIEPGEIVLAGAATSAVYLELGDTAQGVFSNLGSLEFKTT